MQNLPCNRNVATYIQQLGKDASIFLTKDELNNIDNKKLKNTLDEIINDININILTKKYDSFQDALLDVPDQSKQLMTMIKMYNVYVTQCNDSSYTELLKNNMCKNNKIICRAYHLLHLWSLMVLECLIFEEPVTVVDYNTLVKKKINMKKSDACISKIKSMPTSKLNFSKQLIECALHLRQNYKKYCNKPIDYGHKIFIGFLKKTIQEINKIKSI
jgi:peroxiredoxin family protein